MTEAAPKWSSEQRDARFHFAELAYQYYVIGRSAFIGNFGFVAANVLHHSVELAMKAGLSQTLKLPQIKKLDHNLIRIYESLLEVCPTNSLIEQRRFIEEIQVFESIRYPDRLIQEGARIQLAWLRSERVPVLSCQSKTPNYSLVLEDVDEFILVAFDAASINPKALSARNSLQAEAALRDSNRFYESWNRSGA